MWENPLAEFKSAHPRVGGEDLVCLPDIDAGSGSPPRRRGRHAAAGTPRVVLRLTPA